MKSKPLPASLIASLNVCSSSSSPPTKKQAPKQKSIVARMEPRMAALITKYMSLFRRTMKRTISTMEPILEAISMNCGGNDDRAIRDLSEDAKDMRQLSGEFLASEANHVGTRDHGDVGENKDEGVVVGKSI